MKKFLALFAIAGFLTACGGSTETENDMDTLTTEPALTPGVEDTTGTGTLSTDTMGQMHNDSIPQ